MLLYSSHEIFLLLPSSDDLCWCRPRRRKHKHTHRNTRWCRNDGWKFLSCSKLNQANFHLSFSHIYVSTYSQQRDMFQKLNIRFQLHCLLPFYLLSFFVTISGHKQRAFLRFLKLLYISNHLLCCCCCCWCSFT